MTVPFEKKVTEFIKRNHLLNKGTSVLIGVSGGPDSLALLHFFTKIQKEWDLRLMVVHVDHMFRGEQSYHEMKYVEKICQEWDIPFIGKQINVPLELTKKKGGSQVIAREMRYSFFEKIMQEHEIPHLAIAHHGDDQIETMLMRMTRGSNLPAVAGMKAKRPFGNGFVIRPFLCVTKEEIEQYCQKHHLKPVYDPTNFKEIYTRNRFRMHVLPFLKEENHHVHIHFQRLSEFLLEDHEYLMKLALEEINKIIVKKEDMIELNICDFLQLPLPLQRRGIQIILNYLSKENSPKILSVIHIQAILDLLRKKSATKRLNLPNQLQVIRSYDLCIFKYSFDEPISYCYEWSQDETVLLPNGDQLVMKKVKEEEKKGDDIFYVDSSSIPFPLYVRTRQDGDRITQKGTGGTKKVKDIFIDEKIPLHKRDEWPIITDAKGTILWIPLLKKSIFEADKKTGDQIVKLIYIKKKDD